MLGLRSASASQRVMSASMRARSDWIGFDIPGSDRWFARQPARDRAVASASPSFGASHLRQLRDFQRQRVGRAIIQAVL